MTRRRSGAGLVVLVVLGCLVPSIVLPSVHGSLLGLAPPDLGAAAAFGAVGAFLLLRGAVMNIAVILCVQGIGSSLTVLCGVVVALAAAHGPLHGATLWIAWVGNLVWLPGVVLLVPLVLLFPDGRLAGPRWRWPIRVNAVLATCFVVLAVSREGSLEDDLSVAQAPNPTGFIHLGSAGAAVVEVFADVVVPGFGLMILVSLGAVIARRRASTGTERAQLTCLLYGAAMTGALLISLTRLPEDTWWAFALGLFGVVPIAVAIGVAVLRYRLYEIDRLVSRTVTYGLVLAVLAGVYVGVLVGLAALLPAGVGQVGVAGATLTVSVLAVPLTRRVRRVVDRRFSRSRFDAERTAQAFAARLRARPDRGDVPTDLIDVVVRTIAPAHAAVWEVPR